MTRLPDHPADFPPDTKTVVTVRRRYPGADVFVSERYPCSASPSIVKYLARELENGTLAVFCGDSGIVIPADQIVDFTVERYERPPASAKLDTPADPGAS
jgi:hypothetical protein